MKRHFLYWLVTAIAFIFSASVAASTIWTNSAGSNAITAVDSVTGALIKQFNPNKGNGRGIVVVGNVVYYTVANSNNVFKLDATTGTDLGIAFSIAGTTGLSAISYNGTNFYVADYSGTKNAYLVSPTGVLMQTIVLANCTAFCDGLEFFNGKLISNRGDTQNPGIYDIYDLNGTVITPAFITDTGGGGRGIAYDGTNFIVANATQISTYSGTTGAKINTITPGGTGQNYEDLSFDFAQRPDTGGPPADISVPTLSEWALILLTLMIAGLAIRSLSRRRS
jgi:IPTL-CTERM motif